jgi:hypothetical protein
MIREYFLHWRQAWNRFWFTPADPIVLGLLRILVGSMLFYTQLVWSLGLDAFLGADGVLPESYRYYLFDQSNWAWSHFDWIRGAWAVWTVHVLGLVVVALWMVGFRTRWTGWLSFLLAVSYANRATGAQFGLDQVSCFLCLYLALGNSGASFSMDRWLSARRVIRRAGQGSEPRLSRLVNSASEKDTLSNVALRLIQVHMCVVYLFAGLGKLQGESWWNGEAIWGALASYEYQTLDLTWLASQMWVVNVLTFVTLAWEVSYAFLIWPRLTRPVFLIIAVMVHLGIGLAMGMMTFGLIMIYGNGAFVRPEWIRALVGRKKSVTNAGSVVVHSRA